MLLSAKECLNNAKKDKYALGAFTTYNLEWTKAILLGAEELKSPVIISVSSASAKYFGGFKSAFNIIKEIDRSFNISVPVIVHLDHGSYEAAMECIDLGYSSVMFDGSKYAVEENIRLTSDIVKKAKIYNIVVEAEVGAISGMEDGITVEDGELADPKICKMLVDTGIDMLAAGIGNIHGEYPKKWKGLNFSLLEYIAKECVIPLVLHGGSGISNEQIRRSIALGISKINVNTECQIGFAKGIENYIKLVNTNKNGWYNPIKLFEEPTEHIKKVVMDKIKLFGSVNKY